ncbi:hypothetical protein STEG23_010300, partial [Scotinomys teguina]
PIFAPLSAATCSAAYIFYILSSWRADFFPSCCLDLDSSSSFPCPAFQAFAKSALEKIVLASTDDCMLSKFYKQYTKKATAEHFQDKDHAHGSKQASSAYSLYGVVIIKERLPSGRRKKETGTIFKTRHSLSSLQTEITPEALLS